jgi:hypothetical protein
MTSTGKTMRDQGDSREDPTPPQAPAGRRWGRGAWSVLPYLVKSLQARPSANAEAREAANKAARHSSFTDSTRPT